MFYLINSLFIFKDGHYYLKLHDQSCDEIHALCREYEKYVDEADEQNRVQNEEGIIDILLTSFSIFF